MSAAQIIREAPTQGDPSKFAPTSMGESVHLPSNSGYFAQTVEHMNLMGQSLQSTSTCKVSAEVGSGTERQTNFSGNEQKMKVESDSSGSDFKERGSGQPSWNHGKRKFSLSSENNKKYKKRRKTIEKSRTVSKFLLGGNITDPLNLNSLVDAEVSKIANAQTPVSSPLPERNKDPDPVIVPQDIRDPLKLNSDTDDSNPNLVKIVCIRKRKRRNSFRSQSEEDLTSNKGSMFSAKDALTIEVKPHQIPPKQVVDKIVSPVIPEVTRKRKQKRKSEPTPHVSKVLLKKSDEKHTTSNFKGKKHHRSPEKFRVPSTEGDTPLPKFRDKSQQYQYGNYVGYYGYRNADEKDVRLTYFRRQWFEGKTCLDIGCNTGHVTLYIGKTFLPKKIVGMDIDGKLINLARKSMRQCLEDSLKSKAGFGGGKFPVSMKKCYGELPLLQTEGSVDSKGGSSFSSHKPPDLFPGNVLFRCGNFVLSKDDLLKTQKEEYDTILALSITKWIHLNWGDDGLKRFFRRIFLALKPGGRFILEPQAWPSYIKKKKMTETTYRNFHHIKFKPNEFKRFLLRDVGFSSCEVIGTPMNQSKGFRRQLLLFTKLKSKVTEDNAQGESNITMETDHSSDISRSLSQSSRDSMSFTVGEKVAEKVGDEMEEGGIKEAERNEGAISQHGKEICAKTSQEKMEQGN